MTHIAMGLRAAQHLFKRQYFSAERAIMTIEQVLVLAAVDSVWPEAMTIIGIGREAFADRSTVSAMVKTLVRWKYLREIKHEGDARQKLISITNNGKAALRNHKHRMENAEREFIAKLPAHDQQTLIGLLGDITSLARILR